MPLRPPTEEIVRYRRIKQARNKIDLARPGALEALRKLDAQDRPTPVAYEKLAEKYSARELERHAPVDNEQLQAAYKKLIKGTDKMELAIRFGHEDLGFEDPDRIPSGSLMIDWITNGGYPRAMVTQLKGKESRGKTFAAIQAVVSVMSRGGSALWVAAERPNATWMRTAGIPILIQQHELDRMTKEQKKEALAYNESAVGAERFSMMVGKAGDEVLQKVVDAIELNVFDVIVIDSIAVLRMGKRLEGKNVGHEFQGGEAKMINDWCTRLASGFNAVESRRGSKLADAVIGESPRTAVLAINQVREQGIGSYMPAAPDAPGGMGLRHEKVLDLNFLRSEDVAHGSDGLPYARRTIIRCDKSKVGPPRRQGMIEIQFRTIPDVSQKAQFGWVVDLMGGTLGSAHQPGIAEQAGLIQSAGAWYTIGDGEGAMRCQGRAQLYQYLSDPANASVVDALRQAAREWILLEAE